MVFTKWETKQPNLECCIRTAQGDSLNWPNPEATEVFYNPTGMKQNAVTIGGKNENIEPKNKTELIFLS